VDDEMKTEVFWNQVLEHGSEHLVLQEENIIEANGLAVGVVNDAVCRIKYHVICDTDWNVTMVKVEDLLNKKEILLTKTKDNKWLDEGNRIREDLHSCSDVDIMVTPFTNTLPIRRLNLDLHGAREIAVMYVRIPNLNVAKLHQRYTYVSDDQIGKVFKYDNLTSGFTSELRIDADGLVTDYPNIFKMVWKKREP
jgi:hypothetical protein